MARIIGAASLVLASVGASIAASPAQVSLFDRYVAAAKAEPGYTGPSAERGRAFFFASHAGGKADTPACTACHTSNLAGAGETCPSSEILRQRAAQIKGGSGSFG